MTWGHDESRRRIRCGQRVPVRRDVRVDLGARESVRRMENVILSIGAGIVMLYLIVALIRPEWF
jgi:hypothetical protein